MEKLFLDVDKAKNDDCYFSERILGFNAFPYQAEVDWSVKRILIRGGRRTGKDTLVIKRRIIPFLWKNKNVKVGAFAPGWEEADAFMDIFRDAVENSALNKSVVVNNKFDITLSNGSRLLCRIASKTSTGKRGRGFDLLYYIEAAYITAADMAATRPTRLIGSAPEILTSSPNGENHFQQAEYSGVYKVYHWKTSMNPLISHEDLEEERKLCTELEYTQEYEGEYISGVGQAIPDKLIEKMYADKGLELQDKGVQGCHYIAGVDLGRRRDKSTVYIIRVDWPELTVVYYREFEIMKEDPRFWIKVLEHLEFLAESFNLTKIKIDQTGLGDMPVMELKRSFSEKSMNCIVEGVDFTYSLKHKWEGIINQGILKFERYQIHSPFIKKLVVQLKSIRFNAETKMYETKGPSPDHVMALFLAMSAVQQVKPFFGTASNYFRNEFPFVEHSGEKLSEKISDGYIPKISEMDQIE